MRSPLHFSPRCSKSCRRCVVPGIIDRGGCGFPPPPPPSPRHHPQLLFFFQDSPPSSPSPSTLLLLYLYIKGTVTLEPGSPNLWNQSQRLYHQPTGTHVHYCCSFLYGFRILTWSLYCRSAWWSQRADSLFLCSLCDVILTDAKSYRVGDPYRDAKWNKWWETNATLLSVMYCLFLCAHWGPEPV